MASKKASGDEKAVENLQAVPGVGKTIAQKLVKAGIRTVNQLAKASAKKLLAAGLTANIGNRLALAAGKMIVKKVTKKAAPKVKAAVKAAPKRVAKTIKMAAKTAAAKGTKKAKKAPAAKKAPTKRKAAVTKKATKQVEVSSKTVAIPDWRASIKRWKNDDS
jgi:hypothetical protein